jgi:hypothetical protein
VTIKPKREPDLIIGLAWFWWEEKIMCSDVEYVYYFNPDDETFLHQGSWRGFSGDFLRVYGYEFRESYAKWLLEQQLLSK